MTKRIFVCHAKSAIEPTSEAVDIIENSLELSEGTLLTSSLPGYSSDTRSEDELRAMLGGTHLVIALVNSTNAADAEFNFELGAAWALGIDVLPVLLGDAESSELPWPLRAVPGLRVQTPSAFIDLAHEVSARLGIPPRAPAPPSEPAAEEPERQPPSVSGFAPAPNADGQQVQAPGEAVLSGDSGATANEGYAAQYGDEPPTPQAEGYAQYGDEPPAPQAEAVAAASVPVAANAASAPVAAEAFDGQAGDAADEEETTATRGSVSVSPVVQVSPSEPPATSAVYARLPTCELSLETGRCVSDCLFNRAEINDFEAELSDTLGSFIDAIGGSWEQLRELADLDVWVDATQNLLASLPEQTRRIADWYQLGIELGTLHNLAGQLLFDGGPEDEARWRDALDRFLLCAETARIGYEELGRVLALLENLALPRGERDLSNIGRSLAEVRRYAAGADGIHTAA